ncbi:MAG: helix-turn-helix domain-containing protein [Parvibaculaceae bacterium]|nr:helix-turn-helix domain-containing protein [Parvibaculaceae bacterium]
MSKYAERAELVPASLARRELAGHRGSPERWLRREIERTSNIALLQETVALAWCVSIIELRAPTRRCARVAFARQVAMYLGHVTFGLSLSAVGRHFGRDRTTAGYACRTIEDLRDDRHFDQLLERLEIVLRVRQDRLNGEEAGQ